MARPNLSICLVMSLLFLGTTSTTAIGKIIYVDAHAPGANNGVSWLDAFNYLQDALAIAQSGDEIRVAQGLYTPDRGGGNRLCDREATFQLINDVTINGGYAGFDEPDPNTRDITAYETILSGDLGINNSYHVVTGSGTDSTAVLDGFTITGGNAIGGYTYDNGGGMYNKKGSPTLSRCTFRANSAMEGGGMHNEYNSSPILTNCTFINNQAEWYGGGMSNYYGSSPTLTNCAFIENYIVVWGSGGIHNDYNSSPTLTNCTFSGNYVNAWGAGIGNYKSNPVLIDCRFSANTAGHGGGGINNGSQSSPILINCTFNGNLGGQGGGMRNQGSATLIGCIFVRNSAKFYGGGMSNTNQSDPILTNCTFSGNSAPNGNALSCNSLEQKYPSNLQLTNCILWDGGNEIWNNDNSVITITYSDVEGGWPGEGNINIYPYFADPNNGDFHLKSQAGRWDPNKQSWVQDDVTSPCIDAGDISSPIGFEPFPNGNRVNMGAYGGRAQASKSYFGSPVCTTIVAGDINGDCTVDFKDFTIMLSHWLEEKVAGDINGDCTVNFVDFAIMVSHWLEEK